MALFPKELDHWLGHWPMPAPSSNEPAHYPPVNLEVSPEQYDYYIFAAGVDKEQLTISAEKNVLTISGDKPQFIPQDKTVTVYRNERLNGKFSRSINLPHDVNVEHISAKYLNGVLHIVAQRSGKTAPTTIEIT
jgi:HSP20 family protein